MFTHRVDDELELELLHDRLAPELFAAVDGCREHLRAWLPWVDDTLQILDSRLFLRLSMAGWGEGRMLRCAIRVRGELCGAVSVEGIDRRNDSGEIGYWLAQSHTGRGTMTRSVAAITDLAFGMLDLHRLTLRAAVDNTASWAVPERLGWTLEGTARDDAVLRDQRLDMRVYSLLRPEWSAEAESGE